LKIDWNAWILSFYMAIGNNYRYLFGLRCFIVNIKGIYPW
jgi:hypothetical protein